MGADLIGYFAFIPEKARKIAKRRLDELEMVIQKAGGFDKLQKESGVDAEAVIKKLERLGVPTRDFEGLSAKEILTYFQEDIALAREFVRFKPDHLSYRDLASAQIKVNGKLVSILFAGDMSWGDEPDGAGYITLRALNRTGVEDVLFRAVPWDMRRKRASTSAAKKR